MHFCIMITYFDQLKSLSTELGIPLKDACREEGIAMTTLMRWEKREAHPREETAASLFDRIKVMASTKSTTKAAE